MRRGEFYKLILLCLLLSFISSFSFKTYAKDCPYYETWVKYGKKTNCFKVWGEQAPRKRIQLRSIPFEIPTTWNGMPVRAIIKEARCVRGKWARKILSSPPAPMNSCTGFWFSRMDGGRIWFPFSAHMDLKAFISSFMGKTLPPGRYRGVYPDLRLISFMSSYPIGERARVEVTIELVK